MIEQQIQYNKVIINAVPVKITRNENPAAIEIKFDIKFETPTGLHIKIGPKTIEEILAELKSKGLVYKTKAAEEALPAILNAYYRENKMIIKSELETPGFYLENDKIVSYKTDQKEATQDEIKQCADLLNDLSNRYNRKEIFATVVKWALIAPFSYVLKQMQHDDRWLPWLYFHGWTNTGKTTTGRIALAVWRKNKDRKKHDIGFASVDNIARFGRAVCYNTYPILINEVQLNDERQKQLVEALKHAVQSQTARARLSTKSTAEFIAALSPCILTSNPAPPEDPAFQRRIIPIHYSTDDEPSAEERARFNTFLKDNIDKLGTFGDFAVNYILNNQETIFTKSDWKDIATELLKAFFKAAEKEVPAWIYDFVQESQVQDIAEEQEQIIRGFLTKVVNETYTRNYRALTSSADQAHENNDFENRLLFCLDKDLISFLKRKSTGEVLIMHDIVKEMKAQRINHISNLAELGRRLQSEVKATKLGGNTVRLVAIPIQKFIDFVLPPLS
ncbi:MAG: hypothetical protein DLM72_12090 [Candidatus Nitrosopolaris wilkensis]|nr:MAG: hypothetical protein DLM72_12090 [Candidatus Nitrosopolaris wilkensis]